MPIDSVPAMRQAFREKGYHLLRALPDFDQAGHAKGGADVTLVADGDTTILTYEAKAQIGGKLAQLGSRLIQSTSKKLAAKFFKNFADVLDVEKVG